jgi:hypothetical protein
VNFVQLRQLAAAVLDDVLSYAASVVMPSIFKGATLVASVHPFASTFQENLLLDTPRAAKARGSINRWVAGSSETARREIQQRLLAPRNAESSRYAFYELLTGQAIKKLMGNVVREPAGLTSRGNPDFAATVGGQQIVFEVRTLEEEMPEAERKGRAVLHELAGIRASWVVVIDWAACFGLQGIRLAAMRRAVTQDLDASTQPHHFDIAIGEARLVGDAYPTKSEMSIIQTRFASSWSPGVEHIRKAVEEKARAYRDLKAAGIPFVVALCTDDPLIDAESLCTALFGDSMVRVELMNGHPVRVQEGLVNFSGCLTPNTKGVVQNTIVSAVCLLHSHLSQSGWTVQLAVAHNPWAANAFSWTDDRVAVITFARDGDAVEFAIPSVEPGFEVR